MATAKARPGFPAAIIFDLDGTLVDSGPDLVSAVNAALGALGRPPLPLAITLGHIGDGVEMLMRRVLAHGTALSADRVAAADLATGLAAFRAHYGAHTVDHTRCYPGVIGMLTALGGRPLFLATNKPRVFTLRILERLGLSDHFAAVVAGDDVPRRKPDPAHLAACLQGRDVLPARVAMVGDGLADLGAARNFGAVAVAVTYGYTPRASLLAENPDLVADSPAEVVRVLGLG